MTPADRISEAHAQAWNAKVAVRALEALLAHNAGKEQIEMLAGLVSDQLDRALAQLQPFVDGEVVA